MRSDIDGTLLAELRPDALITDHGQALCVADAKYKFLHDWPGPAREDLYQLTAYVTRYGGNGPRMGALIYPEDTRNASMPGMEMKSPWRIDATKTLSLLTIPHEPQAAVEKLRAVLL